MIYLDYQATTPLAPEAKAAMLPWLDKFGNPHSPHKMGREAKAAVELAREQVLAALIGHSRESGHLWFTAGATEAVNWAIKGTLAQTNRRKIVTVATEHACVLDSAEGYDHIVLPVDASGAVDLDAARAAIDDRTALVAAMHVNNEIGTIGRVEEIGHLAREAGAVMLCDAVQGFGRVALPIHACDLIAMSAHKVHGPKAIGALWVREGCVPAAILHGGGQEGGIRSGTLSPMLCAGFGAATKLLKVRDGADADHVEQLWAHALDSFGPGWAVNGSTTHRYLGNLNLRRDGLDAARLISEVREVAFSAGSACASGSGRPSHVLKAIGLSDAEAKSSIRLGFGRYTTEAEIDEAAALINAAAERQREWA